MPGIHLNCFLNLLGEHDITPSYQDPHTIGMVSYLFTEIGKHLNFTHGCVPPDIAYEYLREFGLEGYFDDLTFSGDEKLMRGNFTSSDSESRFPSLRLSDGESEIFLMR